MNYTQLWLFANHKPESLRQSSLLMLLACGVGNGQLLLQALQSHELESRGVWASKISQLRLLLEQGQPLVSALCMVDGILPVSTISMIRTADSSGALPDVLLDEARRLNQRLQTTRTSFESLMLSTMVVCSVGVIIAAFLFVMIVPKLKYVYEGFGIALPQSTMMLIGVSEIIESTWIVLLLPVSAIIGYGLHWYYSSMKCRLTYGYHRLALYFPRLWVPGLLRQFSVAAASNQPFDVALHHCMADLPPGRASRAIGDLRHRVMGGDDVIDAMAELKLINRREKAFLRSSMRTRHIDWGLRHLAVTQERNLRRLQCRLIALMFPAVTMIAGGFVLFVALAFLSPMIKILLEFQ